MKINPAVLLDIERERERQETKWGEQNHPPEWWEVILLEEIGEAAKGLLEGDGTAYRAEMIQAAAVTIAAIESLDRASAKSAGAAAGTALFSSLAGLQKENKDLRDALEKVGKLVKGAKECKGKESVQISSGD